MQPAVLASRAGCLRDRLRVSREFNKLTFDGVAHPLATTLAGQLDEARAGAVWPQRLLRTQRRTRVRPVLKNTKHDN